MLPQSPVKRWSPKIKSQVVSAIQSKKISFEEAQTQYAISADELQSWMQRFKQHGRQGLSLVYLQSVRRHEAASS